MSRSPFALPGHLRPGCPGGRARALAAPTCSAWPPTSKLAGAKLVLVGDDRQLASVSPGGALGALVARYPGTVPALSENRRQLDPDDRRVQGPPTVTARLTPKGNHTS
ncbi:MAG TPA: AAA family ATPase [Acidimicrobiales bacterium]|nr:AAA family ATPase [Acidimicrobiales bacterium]